MRQLIIARKDLNMSPGKLAAQCCHASVAFLSHIINEGHQIGASDLDCDERQVNNSKELQLSVRIRSDVYFDWLHGAFTKTVCEAKNRNQLLKAAEVAREMGLAEGEDFFLIFDACLTELEPENVDENGEGCTLTCIGFRPLPDDVAHAISKKYQLYRA